MIALGLLLLAAVGTVGVAVALSNSDATAVSALGVTVSNLTLGGLFALGAAAGAVLVLSLMLVVGGARTRRARHVATRKEVRQARRDRDALQAENDDLRAKVEDHPQVVDVTDGSVLRTRA